MYQACRKYGRPGCRAMQHVPTLESTIIFSQSLIKLGLETRRRKRSIPESKTSLTESKAQVHDLEELRKENRPSHSLYFRWSTPTRGSTERGSVKPSSASSLGQSRTGIFKTLTLLTGFLTYGLIQK